VATQQILTSYRFPGCNCSSRSQCCEPLGLSSAGNLTGSALDIRGWAGDRRFRQRSSRPGWTLGSVMRAGARKMVFSTLACTGRKQARRHRTTSREMRGRRDKAVMVKWQDASRGEREQKHSSGRCSFGVSAMPSDVVLRRRSALQSGPRRISGQGLPGWQSGSCAAPLTTNAETRRENTTHRRSPDPLHPSTYISAHKSPNHRTHAPGLLYRAS